MRTLTRRTCRVSALAVAVAIGVSGTARAGQETPAATFRSSIDLVRVDVSVLDRDGRPVQGLAAGDFVVSVDGRRRQVVTADYFAAPPPEAGAKAPAAPTHYSSNAGAAGGRLIMFVVDQGTIVPGRARQVTAAAERFLSGLNPSDRVGLVTVPAMDQVEFTANHGLVRSRLQKLGGIAPPAIGVRRVSVVEAFAIARGEQRALESAVTRECAGIVNAFERRMCSQEVMANASSLYSEMQERSRNTIGALRSLLLRLEGTPEPKTVILISGGLILDQDFAQVSWFGPLAARAQATVYSFFVVAPYFEASLPQLPLHYRDDMSLAEEGLGHVANLGRGSLFRVVTDPWPAFERLGREISAYYLLGFEADASDRDERAHAIRVDVPARNGVEVRARPEFSAAAGGARTVEAILAETVRAPLPASEIRLRATTYTFRETAGQGLRVVVGAEIDRTRDTAGRMALAFFLFDSTGQVVARHMEPDVSTRINPRTGSHQYFASAPVQAAGVYTLKVAVVDDLRRRGSVEHTFNAQLTDVGPLRTGDLLLAEAGSQPNGDAQPVVSADYTSDLLGTLVELYSDRADALRNATVTFELADSEDGRAITTVDGAAAPTSSDAGTSRAVQAVIPIGLLPPGRYLARAVIAIGGRRAGQVAREFSVSRSVVMSGRMPSVLPSRLDAFDRQAVLSGEVVGFFLDRLAASHARASDDAVAHARNGRFEALFSELQSSASDSLSAAFLGGLVFYARGELDSAMGRFREALKVDSEFFPAAFYLGACYAAAGRDREAANAWRTSLVTESEAPFIYPLIADALVRARDAKGAVAILEEAAALWPDNDPLQGRLGVAYAMSGRTSDAVRTLDPYLARHPGDHEKLFVVLRALYQARAAGVSMESAERDRGIFARYAEAYAKAGGTEQALVQRWKKFLDGK